MSFKNIKCIFQALENAAGLRELKLLVFYLRNTWNVPYLAWQKGRFFIPPKARSRQQPYIYCSLFSKEYNCTTKIEFGICTITICFWFKLSIFLKFLFPFQGFLTDHVILLLSKHLATAECALKELSLQVCFSFLAFLCEIWSSNVDWPLRDKFWGVMRRLGKQQKFNISIAHSMQSLLLQITSKLLNMPNNIRHVQKEGTKDWTKLQRASRPFLACKTSQFTFVFIGFSLYHLANKKEERFMWWPCLHVTVDSHRNFNKLLARIWKIIRRWENCHW